MTTYISNAFSLSMLIGRSIISVTPVPEEVVRTAVASGTFISAVGHQATAEVISQRLGLQITCNRVNITLLRGERLFVFQLKSRLSEGRVLTTEELETLPAEWLRVEVQA